MNITYDLNYDDLDDVDYDVTLFRVDADSHILTDDEFDDKLNDLLDFVFGRPEIYEVFDTATGYAVTGSKQMVQFFIDHLIEAGERSLRITYRKIRNDNGNFVLGLVENVIQEDFAW